MSLEFRPAGTPHCFDLMEGDDPVGELQYYAPEEDGDRPSWAVELWSVMGTGRKWYADVAESHEEAADHARELYKELVAERRELSRGAHPRTISSPMGGQRRKP